MSADPAVTSLLACPTAADWARLASGGRWKLARHLALFNRLSLEMAARRLTRVAVSAPPRHGKSSFFSRYLTSWWLGTFPDQRVIISSYGADLATSWSAKARADFEGHGPAAFGLSVRGKSRSGSEWSLAGRDGGVKAAGVGGPIMGHGGNLFVVDDPFKSAQEAYSPVRRQGVWEWFQSTVLTRLEPDAVLVIVMTRWHQNDTVGRLRDNPFPEDPEAAAQPWHFFNFPALATEHEPKWPEGLDRIPGDSLWPGRFPRPALLAIKSTMSSRWWLALYQGGPTAEEGDLFEEGWFQVEAAAPHLVKAVRFWDLAATERAAGAEDPDWTCGALCGIDNTENFHVKDLERFRGKPAGVLRKVRACALADGPGVPVVIEKEGGASGKIAIDLVVRWLRRHGLRQWRITGQSTGGQSKVARADPVAALAENGMLYLVRAAWNKTLIEEHCLFPGGTHDDTVDAVSGAHAYLAGKARPTAYRTGEQANPDVFNYRPPTGE